MTEIRELTVRFGGVTPIQAMDLTLPGGACGLIGPNGAGKTTFFNVLSGFVTPATGRVLAFGDGLLALPGHRRARWGLRRTFQTEQAIEQLSVYDNVAMVHEHTGGHRRDRHRDVLTGLDFVGLSVSPTAPVAALGAGERRLVELARAVVGRPRVVTLGEPAAGPPDEETGRIGAVIRRIPAELDAMTVLVDHDMSLVSACCDVTAVLDFGRLVAAGPTQEVLRDEQVVRAYLGTEEIA